MKKLLLLALFTYPTIAMGYTAYLINATDQPLKFYLHTSLLGCCCGNPAWDCQKWNGPGACATRDAVQPNTTLQWDSPGGCDGACWTTIEAWIDGTDTLIGYADFRPGACEDVDVMVYGKSGNYVLDKRGGGDVGHIIKQGFEDFGSKIKIDKIRKTPQILQKGFEITGLAAEIAALEVKLASLQAAQKASDGFMKGMKDASTGLLNGLPEVVKAAQIRKIEFEGSARLMASGVFPKGSVEVVIAGKTLEVKDITFDPRNATQSLKDVANKIVDAVKSSWTKVSDAADTINNAFKSALKI
jgi:hypothetical protein